MKFKSEYYNETPIEAIIFSYGFKDGKVQNKENLSYTGSVHNYKNNNNLPISINPMDYGRIVDKYKLEDGIAYILQNEKEQTITFKKFDNYNQVEFFKSGISLVKFLDIFLNKNKFIREIDNKSFTFLFGKEVLFQNKMKTKFIDKTKISKNLINNFLTLDIETFVENNTLIPFLIWFYDGKRSYSFGL
jgi:hypothetical protein